MPQQFLPLAEETGLMHQVTLHVVETAVKQCATWLADGIDLTVAVNLAPADVLDARLPDEVARALERNHVAADHLQLEITESTIVSDPERVLDVLARLSELGVGLSLDDFGTGYSSLAYLKRLPVQELKIDRSFVMGMDADEEDTVIVRSTVELAHNLGLQVVAEGVETRESWAELAGLGCELAQGFLMTAPLPVDEFERWFANWPVQKREWQTESAAAGSRPGGAATARTSPL